MTSAAPSYIESLLGPLAIPKPATPTRASLLLSPALSPIPANIVEKIKSGEYVDMKELLGDNIALHQRMEEVHRRGSSSTQWVTTAPTPKLREVSSPLSWAACFLSFMAVKCTDEHMRDLLTYARLVIDLARKHGGRGWLEYDKTFRKQMAPNPGYTWGELNPSLLAYTILGNSDAGLQRQGTWCTLCQEPDHNVTKCALQSLEPTSPTPSPLLPRPTGPSRQLHRANKWRHDPIKSADELCRKYNRGACTLDPCKYKHACRECQEAHPWIACPNRTGPSDNRKV